MKLIILIIGLFVISGCAQNNQKKGSPQVNIRPFTVQETENCLKYGIEAQTLFSMLKDGLPYEMLKGVFQTKEHATGFTLQQLEQINQIKSTKNHPITIGGYFQSQCLNNLLNIPTPNFSIVESELKECEKLKEPNKILQCSTVRTATAAKRML
ncbi:hypothetical protein [Pleionea sediminis]|uniref:hypothetical protein n=1 Tax=Pleionea sediminis TaxID=2569479 RepID=UPI001186EE02|nr:hypothetical protein [Pleionea sediminis]